jgi:uncharacterized membrane protein YfcA
LLLSNAWWWVVAACGLVMVLGGLVKGSLGVGLPLVAVPLLSLLIPAPQAMGMLVVPVLASNLLQAWQGGRLGFAMRRFGPLMLAQLAATLLAASSAGGPRKSFRSRSSGRRVSAARVASAGSAGLPPASSTRRPVAR